ncbi:hypothetical protein Tco_0735272 [Tanacetum coccineum]
MRLITMSSFDIIKMKPRRSWEDHRLEEEERNARKSNIGDSDNTEDGGKIVGGAIGACGGIGGISSFLEFFKKSEEMLPGVAGK